MTVYTKLVNGVAVPMSAEEISARKAEELAWQSGKADREKKSSLILLDEKMPRYVEDIIDALDSEQRSKIASETINVYNQKKEIRQKQEKRDV